MHHAHQQKKINDILCSLELGKWDISEVDALLKDASQIVNMGDRIIFLINHIEGTPFEFESNLPILPKRELRVRLETLDCITFIYTVLSLAGAKSFEDFVWRLMKIRYQNGNPSNIDSNPDTGNIFDYAYEAFCINAVNLGYLKDITGDVMPKEELTTVSVKLERFRRPQLHDGSQMYVAPRYGDRLVSDVFISNEKIDDIQVSNLQSGDFILMTSGPYDKRGRKMPVLIMHLAIAKMENNNIYFYHATRHFSWLPNNNKESKPLYTSIYYDEERKKEQIGVGIAGTYAGEELNTTFNDGLYFGFNQEKKRTLKNYLNYNAVGVKFMRAI